MVPILLLARSLPMSHIAAAAFPILMSLFHTFSVVAFASISLPMLADPEVVVSLSTVGRRIHHQSPDLTAARLRIQEAHGRANQTGRLSNPQVEAAFEGNRGFHETKFQVGFTQKFPVTDRLRLEREISQIEIKLSEAEVLEVERRLMDQACSCVVNILAERSQRRLLREQAALSGDLAELLSQRVAKGEISPVDASQARLEAASLAVEIRQSDLAETTLVGELKPLLGIAPWQGLVVTGALPEPKLPLRSIAITSRPDLDAARLDEQAAAAAVALEKARRYDDVEGGIFLATDRTKDAPLGYDREGIVGLQLKVPWPLWDHHEGAIQEASAKHERKQAEVQALHRVIGLEAEAALAEMIESHHIIREIQTTLLPLAEEQVALSENGQRSGLGDIQDVFRAREKRLQLAASRLEAIRTFHLARVRYEIAIGKPTI
jgi:cobalt-zinc-cadmium efflux system outer membrane protein